jgi:hypothetical protein
METYKMNNETLSILQKLGYQIIIDRCGIYVKDLSNTTLSIEQINQIILNYKLLDKSND